MVPSNRHVDAGDSVVTDPRPANDVKAVILAMELKKFLRSSMSDLLKAQQARGIATQHTLFAFVRNVERLNAFQHLWNATDLVRIVAARQDVVVSGKRDCQLDGAWIKV